MLKLDNVIEPHLGNGILYSGSKLENATRALILIHGRGGSANSILPLSNEFELRDTLVIAPQASQNTWYPFRFIEKREMNEPDITSGLALIDAIINLLNKSGILTENIFLLGFSQGACLVLDYVARNPKNYGGVFALSGGLIGDEINKEDYSGDLNNSPIFLGCSDFDFHIPLERVYESSDIFKKLNADVNTKIYKNMGHTINDDEIAEVNKILKHKMSE